MIRINGQSLAQFERTLPRRPSGRQGRSYYELYPERLEQAVLNHLALEVTE